MESKVYIVGAGPGDPELLTVKAQRLITEADVILYDRLMNQKILDLASPHCQLIYVGKKENRHSVPQDQINEMLVELAQQCRTVVRLKGGDPFIFGRGGEEELALHEKGIPFESVPGVSSSMAVPAYAGIPLTHRRVSRSFAVITGHLAKDESQKLNWGHYVNVDTLVVLMGVGSRQEIAQELIDAGRDKSEPVAFVERGATKTQRVITCDLKDVAQGETEVVTPAIMIIGQVVLLREKLRWFSEVENFDVPTFNQQSEETSCIF